MSTQRQKTPQNLPAPPKEISEVTLQNLLDVQRLELKNRSEEIQLRHRELDHNSSHAEKILQTQERDRDATRAHVRKVGYANLGFAALVIIVVASLVIVAMMMNKDELARDLVKISVSLAAGAIGGYGFARARQQKNSGDDDE